MANLFNYDFDDFDDNFELNSDFEYAGSDFKQEQNQDVPVRENEENNDNEEENSSQSHCISLI